MFVYWFSPIYKTVDFVWNYLDKTSGFGIKIAHLRREFDLKGLKKMQSKQMPIFFKIEKL
jgi:hypothetical protein